MGSGLPRVKGHWNTPPHVIRATFGEACEAHPAWSPEGHRFACDGESDGVVRRKRAIIHSTRDGWEPLSGKVALLVMSCVRWCAGFLLMAAATLGVSTGSADAQPTPECLQSLDPLLEDTSNSCMGHPTNPKFFDTSTFRWGSRRQLAVNIGNEIQLWDISDAANPHQGGLSDLGVGNQGDSDYDLLNHSICDDCRWGYATFKLGNVIFDLGTDPLFPTFWTQHFYPSTAQTLGGLMFKVGNQQYLLANALPEDCGGDATLYSVNGIHEDDFQEIGCVDVPGYDGVILNGAQLFMDGIHYVYLGMGNRQIYIYEVQEVGGTINLQFVSQPANFRAFLSRGKGMGIDKVSELAVTALSNGGFRIWDISNPAGPIELAHVPHTASFNVNTAAIRYPFVWVGQTLVRDASKTYNIENPSNPFEMDPNFWHPDHPWNSHVEDCEWPQGASFSEEGYVMYLARYSVVQMIDFSGCAIVFVDSFESGDTSAWSAVAP